MLSQQLPQLQESKRWHFWQCFFFRRVLSAADDVSTFTNGIKSSDWKWLINPWLPLRSSPWPLRSQIGWPPRGWPPQILPNASLRRWSLSVRKSLRWSSEGSTPIPSQKTSLKRTSGRWLIKVLFQGILSGWVFRTPKYNQVVFNWSHWTLIPIYKSINFPKQVKLLEVKIVQTSRATFCHTRKPKNVWIK